MAEGTPEQIAADEESVTAPFLRDALGAHEHVPEQPPKRRRVKVSSNGTSPDANGAKPKTGDSSQPKAGGSSKKRGASKARGKAKADA